MGIQDDLTAIKVSIGKIETHMERSIPAMKQVWKNKDDVSKLRIIQRVVVVISSAIGVTFVTSIIREYISKHPPPH